MASTVYKEEEITLQSGKDVTLRPLTIGRLRRFMEAWGKLQGLPEEDDGFDVFVNCCGVALEDSFADQFDNLKASAAQKAKGEFLSPEYKEHLMDVLDLDTIYKIIEVSSGIKLNDPKLQEEVLAAAAAQTATE